MPFPRTNHAAIYDPPGDRIIVFGGTSDGVEVNDTWRVSLTTFAWSGLGTGSPPGSGSQVTAAAFDALRRHMLVVGFIGSTWSLDLATGVWSFVPTGGSPPSASPVALAYDSVRDRLIATFPGSVWQLPLASSPSWSALAPAGAPPPDVNGALVYDSVRDRAELVRADGSVWALSMSNPPAWNQLSSSPLPSGPRTAPTAVYDSVRDRLLFHGGPGLNDTWAFALGTNTWSQIQSGNPVQIRAQHSSVVVPPWDAMLTFGGDGGNDTWRFALDGSGFSAVSAAGIPPVVRNAHAMIYDPVRQRVLVFGGRSTTAYLNDLHALSIGGTPTWSSIAASGSPPAPREGSQAIYDPIRDRMVVWGGLNDANRFTDVWALDLAGTPTWSQLVADGGLSGFYPGSPAVYDSRRDRLVVMGATIADTHTKAWALPFTGPPSWTPLAGGTSVTQRFYISAAYDSVNDRVLTFGGASDDFTSTLGDLLALNLSPGESWSTLSASDGAPLPRFEYTIVRDASRGRLVLFGGLESYSQPNTVWGTPAVWFLTDQGALVDVPKPGAGVRGVPRRAPAGRSLGGEEVRRHAVTKGELPALQPNRRSEPQRLLPAADPAHSQQSGRRNFLHSSALEAAMKVLSVLRIAPSGVGGCGWELNRIVKSFAIDGRFVFAAEPGAYRLCKAEGYGRTGSMRNYLELPLLENPSPDPTFEIRKDEVSYLGRVSADVSPARSQKRGTKVVTVTHVRRRQKFLLKLADRASRTPWGDRLRSSATAEPSAADSLP